MTTITNKRRERSIHSASIARTHAMRIVNSSTSQHQAYAFFSLSHHFSFLRPVRIHFISQCHAHSAFLRSHLFCIFVFVLSIRMCVHLWLSIASFWHLITHSIFFLRTVKHKSEWKFSGILRWPCVLRRSSTQWGTHRRRWQKMHCHWYSALRALMSVCACVCCFFNSFYSGNSLFAQIYYITVYWVVGFFSAGWLALLLPLLSLLCLHWVEHSMAKHYTCNFFSSISFVVCELLWVAYARLCHSIHYSAVSRHRQTIDWKNYQKSEREWKRVRERRHQHGAHCKYKEPITWKSFRVVDEFNERFVSTPHTGQTRELNREQASDTWGIWIS